MNIRCLLIGALYWVTSPVRWFTSLGPNDRAPLCIVGAMWLAISLVIGLNTPANWWHAIIIPPLGIAAFSAAIWGVFWVAEGIGKLWGLFCCWVERAYNECHSQRPDKEDQS